MSAKEYRLSLSRVSQAVESYTFQVLARLATSKLSQKQWLGLVLALFPHIRDGRLKTLALAADFYQKERDKHEISVPFAPHDINIGVYTPQAAARALEPVRAVLLGLDKLQPQDKALNAAKQASRFAALHVEHGARDGLQAMVKADEAALGWARTDPEPPSCAFCLTLISRGPVYKHGSNTEAAPYHLNDTCVLVPVFTKTGWAGEEHFIAAKKVYKEALRRVGGDTSQVINELRKL